MRKCTRLVSNVPTVLERLGCARCSCVERHCPILGDTWIPRPDCSWRRMVLSEFAGGYTTTFAKNLLEALRVHLDKAPDKPCGFNSAMFSERPQQRMNTSRLGDAGEPETRREVVLESGRCPRVTTQTQKTAATNRNRWTAAKATSLTTGVSSQPISVQQEAASGRPSHP